MPSPDDVYRARVVQYEAVAESEDARSRWYSRARLLVAAMAVAALVVLVRSQLASSAAVLGFSVVMFVWLVMRHDRIERRRDAALAMVTLNEHALARRARSWQALPAPWLPALPDDHPFAADLDVFGHASLTQVLGPVRTPTGRRTLADWLLYGGASTVEAIHDRQAAVRELVPALDFRQQLSALARLLPEDAGEAGDRDVAAGGALGRGAERSRRASMGLGRGGRRSRSPRWRVPSARSPAWSPASWWLLTGLLAWVLRWWVHEPLEHADRRGVRRARTSALGCRDRTRARGAIHRRRCSPRARADIDAAPAALRQLEQLVALSDVRHTAWLFVPLHTLTSWDLHVWWLIERWRRRHGTDVRRWLEAVGHIDAAGGLAALAFDQPQWTFPVIDPTRVASSRADAWAIRCWPMRCACPTTCNSARPGASC